MRPIDADKLHYKRVWIANIQDGEYRGMKSAVVVFADEIDKNKKARLTDVAPVVRCGECAVPHNRWTGCPKLGGLIPPDDFYCGFGRKDGVE